MNAPRKHFALKDSAEKDWDVMREILLEVENLCFSSLESIEYTPSGVGFKKVHQAFLLNEKGFIHGVNIISCDGDSLIAYSLTREGREVLGSMRSQPVWVGIKKLAQQKSVELTVSTIRNLSTFALKTVFMIPKQFN